MPHVKFYLCSFLTRFRYRINEATNRWGVWGQIEGDSNKLFSVVKVLGNSATNSTFVVGESRRGENEGILRLPTEKFYQLIFYQGSTIPRA